MRLERGLLALHHLGSNRALITRGMLDGSEDGVSLSPDDLRWLCLVAGPALLNELEKEAKNGDG